MHRVMTPVARPIRHRRMLLAVAVVLAMVAQPTASLPSADAATGPACAAAPIDARFPDVPSRHIFADAIRCVAGYGLVSGYPDDTYRPGDPVTRGEAAVFVLGAIETSTGVQLPDPGTNPFGDVSRTGVLGPAILRLHRAGIIGGKSHGTYAPGDALTRGEMSQIVAGSLSHLRVALDASPADYSDVPADGTFAPAISQLTNARIVQGLGDGRFGPGMPVTRGQLAKFVGNSIEALHDEQRWLPTISDPAWTSLHGSLEHRRVSLPGPRVVNVLRWRLDDPAVQLNATYAGGTTYRDTVVNAARRRDAVAAVNGGFWVNGTDPDGLLVRGHRLDSDTSVTTNGSRNIRSGFALRRDGTPVTGIPSWYGGLTLQRPDGTHVHKRIDGVNRAPFPSDEVVLFAPGTYAQLTARPGRYYVVSGVPKLTVNGTQQLQVVRAHAGPGPVRASADESVIWVSADTDQQAYPDDWTPTLRVNDIPPEWEAIRTGLVAGPWLLADGQATSEAQWRSEGFTGAHTDVRHPRSAIGFTDAGQGLIVTVDGRRPGSSVGSTHRQVAELMASLGAVDAVMLDGGGSTQMVVDGQLANRPCCDVRTRTVATVLTLEPR